MAQRTRVRGRGTVDDAEHALHGAKVDLLERARGGDWIVRVREQHGAYAAGALARIPAARIKLEPP